MTDNFPKSMINIKPKIQEAEISRKPAPNHIIFKFQKIKNEKLLKTVPPLHTKKKILYKYASSTGV